MVYRKKSETKKGRKVEQSSNELNSKLGMKKIHKETMKEIHWPNESRFWSDMSDS